MKLQYTLSGGQVIIKPYPVYWVGAAGLEGAAMVKGATPGTNQGFAIIAPASCAGVLGVTTKAHTLIATQTDSKQDGSVYTREKLIVNSDAVFLCELSAPATAAIAVASTSTTTVTVTNLEDDIDGGWLWGSDGQVQWIAAAAAGSCTTKTATGWTSATTISRLLPLFKILQDLNATADKLLPAAAIGTGKVISVENWIQLAGGKREVLDPTKHSGNTYPIATTKLFASIMFQNHAFAPIGAS